MSDFCDLSVVEGGVPVTPDPRTPEEGSHNFFKKYDQRAALPVPPHTQGEELFEMMKIFISE